MPGRGSRLRRHLDSDWSRRPCRAPIPAAGVARLGAPGLGRPSPGGSAESGRSRRPARSGGRHASKRLACAPRFPLGGAKNSPGLPRRQPGRPPRPGGCGSDLPSGPVATSPEAGEASSRFHATCMQVIVVLGRSAGPIPVSKTRIRSSDPEAQAGKSRVQIEYLERWRR